MDSSENTNRVILKFSEVLANTITNVYKVGNLALVFVFIGLLLVTIAHITDNVFSRPTFWAGIILLIVSFMLFLFQQIKTRSPRGSDICFDKEILDNIQNLSIELVDLTANVQSFSLKHINDIHIFVSAGLPYLQKLPFIPEQVRKAGLNAADINNSIVDYTTKSKRLINEIKAALTKADLKKMKIYAKQVEKLNKEMVSLLKQI